ncbi:MAG: hypothetical protein IPH07_19255 [Deltaproteobacteria bacterium]|nr:hypothetical protein [Deltaproteobacteria bacterium]MBK8715842.1 hypothetical protein [Deltaproteobacteria bacterium]MBP7286572.1 hypothetical protein [Nannocystaceae bacterium]
MGRSVKAGAAAGLVPILALGLVMPAHGRDRPRRGGAVQRSSAAEPRPPGCDRVRALCCEPGEPTCTRPGAARVLLLSLGALAGATAATVLFVLGDRLAKGDPAVALVGTGAVAGAGALLGVLAGRTIGDGPKLDDRVRRESLGIGLVTSSNSVQDERRPPTMSLRVAPTWWFRDGSSRMRLLGELGGWLGAERQVDPRPQLAQGGARPVTLEQRRLAMNLAIDLAVALPYPAVRRSAHLGPAELRWRPEVAYRRDWLSLGDGAVTPVERTMLLPLLVGARWHLSPRQRFTFMAGPRFDIVSSAAPGARTLQRGRAQLAPLYAEAWYDLDVPFTERPRRDGRSRRAGVSGLVSLGYRHTRFDGRGINFGPVIGFLGAVHVDFTVRVRPVGSRYAFQGGVGAIVGNGVALTFNAGTVLPPLLGAGRRNSGGRR